MEKLTVQICIDGKWCDAAEVDFVEPGAGTDGGTGFNYKQSYFFERGVERFSEGNPERGHLAASIALPLIVNSVRDDHWPSFLLDLMPQGEARGPLLKQLGFRRNDQSPKVDYPLLRRAAGNPIGNLRIKESAEEEAERLAGVPVTGITMTDVVERSTKYRDFVDRCGLLAASASSVQGAWPKMLLTRAKDGLWYPDVVVPDDQAVQHVIVKLLRNNTEPDRRILAAEAPYLEVARRFGLKVARPLEAHPNTVVIPRFDREITKSGVIRHGQESIVSAAGVAEFGASNSHEDYLALIKRVSVNPHEDVVEYLKRDVLNFAMGNPDNHGRNTAFQKRADGPITLSPLFDFNPMRLDGEGVVRSTRWECLKRNELRPNWETVCEVAAEGLMPKSDVARELLAMAPLLRDLSEICDECGVDRDTFDIACSRRTEIAEDLEELQRIVDAAPENTFKR